MAHATPDSSSLQGLALSSSQGGLQIKGPSGLALDLPPGFLSRDRFRAYATSTFGSYHFFETPRTRIDFDQSQLLEESPGQIRLSLSSSRDPSQKVEVRAKRLSPQRVRVEVQDLSQTRGRAFRFRHSLGPQDRFFGFGEQFDRVEHRGKKVPLFVSEQGIGRTGASAVSRVTVSSKAESLVRGFEEEAATGKKVRLPGKGGEYDTYYPVTSYIDPGRNLAFLLDTQQRSIFDLGATHPGSVEVEVWEPEGFAFEVLSGNDPLETVGLLSAQLGRPALPPAWAFGTWLAIEGGSDRVREMVAKAKSHGAQLDAVWTQDWVGRRNRPLLQNLKYHWEVDRDTYPDFEGLNQELDDQGIRHLGYINCFYSAAHESYKRAAKNRWMVRKPGLPGAFRIWHSTYWVGLVDFTNPGAQGEHQRVLNHMLDLGMDGWMTDYGEWLPFSGRLFEGDAAFLHNSYPRAYQSHHRKVLEARRPDGDFATFARSGFTKAQGVQQIVWAGDQEVHWDDKDGIQTVVKAGLSAAVSGIPYWTHDVGGYSGRSRSKELLLRWIELGALTPILRTHEGLFRTLNWQWHSDAETADFFAWFTRFHALLARRIYRPLAQRFQRTGEPIWRPLSLHYPRDEVAATIEDQILLGPKLLAAPVLTPRSETRRVYLPEGSWHSIWDGREFLGPQWVEAPAGLGRPPVFTKGNPEEVLGGEWRELLESAP